VTTGATRIDFMTTASLNFSPSGRLEFEHIEVESLMEKRPAGDSKAAPVDDKIDADPLSINFGREKTHVPTAIERMLAGPTIDWLVAFPNASRPKALCERYPHVANRLASGWADVERSRRAVQQLADDPRWGGIGFPALIQDELKRLLQLPARA
jgi:hypothetical protein